MIIKYSSLAWVGAVVSLALVGTGPSASAAPQRFSPNHLPRSASSPPIYAPSVVLGNNRLSARPGSGRRAPARGAGDWRPHLQFALEALSSADQSLRSFTAPNVPEVTGYLRTAYLELQGLPPIFKGHRAAAMLAIKRAANHLKQNPPKPGAGGLTEKAIVETQACVRMYQ